MIHAKLNMSACPAPRRSCVIWNCLSLLASDCDATTTNTGYDRQPADLPPLNIEREKQRLENAIGNLSERGLVELVWLKGQTWHDLPGGNLAWTLAHLSLHRTRQVRR